MALSFDKQSKEFNGMMEELTQTTKLFALELYPVIGHVKSLLQWIQSGYPIFKQLTPWILGVASAMAAYGVAITAAKLKTMGFNLVVMLGPLGKFMALATLVIIVASAFQDYFGPGIWYAVGAVLALTAAAYALNVGLAGIPVIIGLVVTGIATLAQWLWGTDVGHSTFHEALDKMAITFDTIASAIGGLMGAMFSMIPTMFKFLTPFGILMTMWESIMGSSKETEKNMSRMSTTKPLARATDAVSRDSLGDATTAAKTPVYKSDTPDGISAKSTNGSQSSGPVAKPPAQDHKVTLQFDPRKLGFKEFVIDLVKNELSTNQG